jgi:preprotein translocase subunit YajC
MNLLIFIFGFIIFIVYVYFLLTIISKQHKIQRSEHQNAYDELDMDGIGNQGRFPMNDSKKKP